MTERPNHNGSNENRHLRFLLISLIGLILVYPFFIGSTAVLSFLLSIVMLAAIFADEGSALSKYIAAGLAVPFFLLIWGYTYLNLEWLLISGRILGLAFFLFIAYLLFRQIIEANKVTSHIFMGGISIYLILGIIWTFIYGLVDHLIPGSILVAAELPSDSLLGWHRYLYFSFVTLTTLGYGDIIPASPYSQSLIILETITGVFYIAIFIARLIGLYSGR